MTGKTQLAIYVFKTDDQVPERQKLQPGKTTIAYKADSNRVIVMPQGVCTGIRYAPPILDISVNVKLWSESSEGKFTWISIKDDVVVTDVCPPSVAVPRPDKVCITVNGG